MNIRCAFCQMPYTLSRVEMLDALQEMDAHKLTHYDAHCPRCRRATQIPRQRIEMFMPKWREELKQFEQEMKEHPQHEAPLPSHEPAPGTEATPQSEAKAVKKEEPVTKSAPRARKPAPKTAPKEKGPAKKTPAAPSKGKKTTKKSK